MTKRSLFGVAWLGLVACGGPAQAPKSAAESAGAQGSPATQQQAYPPAAPAPATPSSMGAEPSRDAAVGTTSPQGAPSAPEAATRRTALRRDVEAAQRELELAASDCAAACRALGSMERATARLCTLEESQCEDVRVRLRRARERVRASCGGCSDGPSVDPDAPIPSR